MVWLVIAVLIGASAAVWLNDPSAATAVFASDSAPADALAVVGDLLGGLLGGMAAITVVAAVVAPLGWATAVIVASGLRTLPGRWGRRADRARRWLVPAAARAALLGGVSVGAVAGSACGPAAALTALDGADTPPLEVGRPVTSAHAASTGPAARDHVVVSAGASLWAIAADHLGPGASSAQIAAEWPRWYAHNRDVVGPDPNLVVVGTRLAVPPSVGATA